MKIEISIWGIRRGFEKEGFFHTHNNAAIKASQQDRFRKICNSIGNKGFFNVQHIQGKTVISYIDSGVREFLPPRPRPGYAVFSLIISNQEVFEKSPRAVLLELSHFYRSRVGESNQNNFNSAEIEFFLNKLTIAPAPALQIRENISSYTYYADASHIDHFLTGNIPFASFGELIFIPSEYNPTTGKFKELDFIDDSFRSNPQFIDLRLAESRFMKERESDLEKQRIAEQQKKEKQLQIQLIEQVLINMIKLGKFDEANQKYEQFPHKAYINQGITNQLYEHKRVQEDQVKEILTLKQEADLIDSIIMAERKGDLDLALSSYKKLNNKNHANLTVNLKTKLENYDADLKQQRASEEQQKIAKAEAKTARAKRKKMILSLSILAVVGLCATSFFLKVPTSVWDKDADGIYNWSDACPDSSGTIALNGCPDKDKDGFSDQDDKCPNDSSRVCQGCPDLDKDKVPDKIDSCKIEFGSKECFGCPDKDGDSVADKDDKCPSTSGDKSNNGCPPSANVTPPSLDKSTFEKVKVIKSQEYNSLKNIFVFKYIRLINGKYESSDFDYKGFQTIKKPKEIDALNKEFGLRIPGGTPSGNTGGTRIRGGGNQPEVNQPKVNGKKIEFPDKALARELNENKAKPGNRNKLKSKLNDYKNGIISGKYIEDPSFTSFANSAILNIEL